MLPDTICSSAWAPSMSGEHALRMILLVMCACRAACGRVFRPQGLLSAHPLCACMPVSAGRVHADVPASPVQAAELRQRALLAMQADARLQSRLGRSITLGSAGGCALCALCAQHCMQRAMHSRPRYCCNLHGPVSSLAPTPVHSTGWLLRHRPPLPSMNAPQMLQSGWGTCL